MRKYMYLSLIPESLVMSMLPPEEFGNYLATGTQKRSKEEAVFFEVDIERLGPGFDLEAVSEQCVAHQDGTPKHSVYASIYRVLERIAPAALKSLWLTTPDGRVLELKAAPAVPREFPGTYFLIQELAPVHPLIATRLTPVEFAGFVTDQTQSVSVPRVCFVTLDLAGLATDPDCGDASALPYKNITHLRDCLKELQDGKKRAKTVDRIHSQHLHFRCVSGGFYVGGADTLQYYPFPSNEELDRDHRLWWRSATLC
ncbi:MAG: hypothetical protein RRC34_05800 [Lentisphaeria bacterium]|nr:hypothetical protein [Lentisphaeria bacterium]